jgi:membrane protease YdiL (CAAX protease family)
MLTPNDIIPPNTLAGLPVVTSAKPSPLPPLNGTRRDAWLEVGVMLCVGVVPFLASAIFASGRDEPQGRSYLVYFTITGLTVIATALWIMYRSGLSWQEFGFQRWKPRDFLLTLLAFILYWVAWGAAGVLLYAAESLVPPLASALDYFEVNAKTGKPPIPSTHTLADVLLMCAMFLTFAAVEEIVCRSHLLVRFSQLFSSRPAAALVTAAIFASYHLYQGPRAVFIVFVGGVLMAAQALATRRVLPLIVSHAIVNLALTAMYG